MAIKPITRKRLQQEFEKNPEIFWEIMTEDMIGRIPKVTQAAADEFLKTAGPKWESWLLLQSWKIQRRAATEPKHHDSFLGMMAIIGWLLHLATKSPVRLQKQEVSPIKEKPKVDPIQGINEFTTGMLKQTIK